MSRNHERYEKECEEIRKENAILLDQFPDWLEKKKLSEATIRTHRANVDF